MLLEITSDLQETTGCQSTSDIMFTAVNGDMLDSKKALIEGWVMQGAMMRQRPEVITGQVHVLIQSRKFAYHVI